MKGFSIFRWLFLIVLLAIAFTPDQAVCELGGDDFNDDGGGGESSSSSDDDGNGGGQSSSSSDDDGNGGGQSSSSSDDDGNGQSSSSSDDDGGGRATTTPKATTTPEKTTQGGQSSSSSDDDGGQSSSSSDDDGGGGQSSSSSDDDGGQSSSSSDDDEAETTPAKTTAGTTTKAATTTPKPIPKVAADCNRLFRRLHSVFCEASAACVFDDEEGCREKTCSDFEDAEGCATSLEALSLVIPQGCLFKNKTCSDLVLPEPTDPPVPAGQQSETSMYVDLDYWILSESLNKTTSFIGGVAQSMFALGLATPTLNNVTIESVSFPGGTMITVDGNDTTIKSLKSKLGAGNVSVSSNGVIADGFDVFATASVDPVVLPQRLDVSTSSASLAVMKSTNQAGFNVLAEIQFTPIVGSSSSVVTVGSGPVAKTVSIEHSPQRARIVQAFVTTTEDTLYYENRTVSVVMQALSATHQPNVKPARLDVVIQYGNIAAAKIKASCMVTEGNSICTANLDVPKSWFPIVASPTKTWIGITASIAGLSSASKIDVAKLSLGHAELDVTEGGVNLHVPSQPLPPSRRFTVSMENNLPYWPINAFMMVIRVDDSVLRLGSVIRTHNQWAIASSQRDNNTYVVTATRQGLPLLRKAPATLLDLELEIVDTAKAGAQGEFTIDFADIDVGSNQIAPTEMPPVFISRRNGSWGQGSGLVYISSNELPSLFPYAVQSVLMNTAVIDGATVESKVVVRTLANITAAPSVRTDGLSCSSSDPNIVKVKDDCSSVYLDGSETKGGDATISVSHLDSAGEFNVSVFFPEFPLDVSVSINPLKKIKGSGMGDCAVQYQCAALDVQGTFVSNDAKSTFSLNKHVAEQIVFQNKQMLQLTNGLVCGKAGGVSWLNISHPTSQDESVTLGGIKIEVNATATVSVQRLNVLPFGSVSVRSTGRVKNSDGTVVEKIKVIRQPVFSRIGTSGEVQTHVLYSDGTRSPLPATTQGLNVSLTQNNIGSLSKANVFVPSGESHGASIEATWSCGATLLAKGRGVINADFEVPTNLTLEANVATPSQVITHVNDVASRQDIDVATVLNLSTFFEYKNGDKERLLNDSRISYTVVKGNDLVKIEEQGDGTVVVTAMSSNASQFGEAQVMATAVQYDLSVTIDITVVKTEALLVTPRPYPSYAGSDKVILNTLKLMGDSNVGQMAALEVFIKLTNSTLIDVSLNDGLSFTPLPLGLLVIGPTPSAKDLNKNIVHRRVPRSTGNVTFFPEFHGIQLPSFKLYSAPQNVAVQSLFDFDVDNSNSVQYAAQFADGTSLSRDYLFPEDTSATRVPNLAHFESSDTSLVTVTQDATTATMNFLANHGSAVVVVASPVINAEDEEYNEDLSSTFSVVPNLEPKVGELDLGTREGEAVKNPSRVGSIVNVPVTVNSGDRGFNSVHLGVIYDVEALKLIEITPDASLQGGLFNQYITDGSASIAIVTSQSTSIPGLQPVANLQFQIISADAATVTATLFTLTAEDGSVYQSDTSPAANVTFQVSERRGRQQRQRSLDVTVGGGTLSFGRRAVEIDCNESETDGTCKTCASPRQFGDLDGNCVFDIRDVSYLYDLLAKVGDGVLDLSTFHLFQRTHLDVDHDGEINLRDLSLLLDAVVGSRPLLERLHVQEVSRPACSLSLTTNVVAMNGAEGLIAASADKYDVYFWVETQFANTSQAVQDAGTQLYPGEAVQAGDVMLWKAEQQVTGEYMVVADVAIPIEQLSVSVVVLNPTTSSLVVFSGSVSKGATFTSAVEITLPTPAGSTITATESIVQHSALSDLKDSSPQSSLECLKETQPPTTSAPTPSTLSPTAMPTTLAPTMKVITGSPTLAPSVATTVFEGSVVITPSPTVEENATVTIDPALSSGDAGGSSVDPVWIIVIIALMVGIVLIALYVRHTYNTVDNDKEERMALEAASETLRQTQSFMTLGDGTKYKETSMDEGGLHQNSDMAEPYDDDRSVDQLRTISNPEYVESAPPTMLYLGDQSASLYQPGSSVTDEARRAKLIMQENQQLDIKRQRNSGLVVELTDMIGDANDGYLDVTTDSIIEDLQSMAKKGSFMMTDSSSSVVASPTANDSRYNVPVSTRPQMNEAPMRAPSTLSSTVNPLQAQPQTCTYLANCKCPDCI